MQSKKKVKRKVLKIQKQMKLGKRCQKHCKKEIVKLCKEILKEKRALFYLEKVKKQKSIFIGVYQRRKQNKSKNTRKRT